MPMSGIQGVPLEVTVIGCYKLDDKEWISRQDPYVRVEYGGTKYRTKTCTDGGRNPTFQEKFVFTLVEGLRELNVAVWNSNTITSDELIGSGKIPLYKTLTQGFDDSTWPLHSKSGRHSGEIRLILHFPSANKAQKNNEQQFKSKLPPSAPTYATPSNIISQILPHGAPPSAHQAATAYPSSPPSAPSSAYPNPSSFLPTSYPPTPYPPPSYPPTPYPPPAYPPTAYPPTSYPPKAEPFYPPPPPPQTSHQEGYPPLQPYPPPPQVPSYYPPGPSYGMYPPTPPY